MNIEYKSENGYLGFLQSVKNKRVALLCDVNTKPYALAFLAWLKENDNIAEVLAFPDEELIPSEDKCEEAYAFASSFDYLLAVGSGTLNDMAKATATRLGIPSGVLATAASMDGYCSKGAALMRGGFKVTDSVNAPSDVLIDAVVLRSAPRIMTAAGFGDILGKYTCLTDWRMANIVKGEPIDEEAFKMMQNALNACMENFDALVAGENEAIEKLMNALITAGLSMEKCGNSRPASGSEHHISHFLEMDFARRGEKIPLHGVKVALGTLLSITIYRYLKENRIVFEGAEEVYRLTDSLPRVERVEEMLEKLGCPTRFSKIGVRKETLEDAIENAYTVRDRYTVLTLAHDLGLTEKLKPLLVERFY